MKNCDIKISIIIPVYNVEKYLSQCLDSCIHQTLNDIEIICVDDCSPDNSYLILEKYISLDERIKIIKHETNKGLGAARNTGISVARGEYVWFIDSDDYIATEACQLLYDTAKKQDIDILCFNAVNVVEHGDGHTDLEYSDYFFNWPINKIIKPLVDTSEMNGYFPVSACMYISKRSFLCNFSFRTNCYYEDTDFTPILFASAPSVFCIVYTAYYRRITPGSITQTTLSQKKIEDKKAVVLSLRSYIEDHEIPKSHFLHVFYKKFSNYVLDLICCIESIRELNITDNTIAIYGAGRWGKRMLDLFNSLDIKVIFFVDSDIKQQQNKFYGLSVKSPECLINYNGFLFIAVKNFSNSIADTLSGLEYKNLKLLLVDDFIKKIEDKKAKYKLSL